MEAKPIGQVRNEIFKNGEPGYRLMESVIILSDHLPENAFEDIHFFSHLEVLFYFDLHGPDMNKNENQTAGEKQQENTGKSNHGSRLFGNSIVRIIKKEGNAITVLGLDAVNGTNIIDIKPVMNEISPDDNQTIPGWTRNLFGNA